MGIFFKTAANNLALNSVLKTALKTDPNTVKDIDQKASEMATQVQQQTPPAEFSWVRLGVAVVLLALLAGIGIWSATVPSLDAWSKMFLHSFEIVFGGVVGLLGLESATK